MYIAKANITGIFEEFEFGLIAPTESFTKLWIAHTEYTVSQKTIDGEMNTICDYRYISSIPIKRKVFEFGYVYNIDSKMIIRD